MRLLNADLIERVPKRDEEGREVSDRLGNRVYLERVIASGKARHSNWTIAERQMIGRELTESRQKVLGRFNDEDVRAASYIQIEGRPKLRILEQTRTGRWHLLTVEAYRTK